MRRVQEQLLAAWFSPHLDDPQTVADLSRIWFGGDQAFDRQLQAAFSALPDQALAGDLDDWLNDDRSMLALILTLDQLPRNFYRGSVRAFSYDARAQALAIHALEQGLDRRLHPVEALFVYLPFEHAEDLPLQQHCVELFTGLCDRAPDQLIAQFQTFRDYALRHLAVIERFGRFPHRNAALGRVSSAAEAAYLESGGEQF